MRPQPNRSRSDTPIEPDITIESIDIDGSIDGSMIIGHHNVVGFTSEQVSALIRQISSTFEPRDFDGSCPYKGLDFFEEKDADLFFGRDELVVDLVNRVKLSRTVFVTGPSGSGKSSIVRAGLIHALKKAAIKEAHSEDWVYATMKPGRDPLEALAIVFSRLKSLDLADYFRKHVQDISILNACAESILGDRADQRFVLFIDQFEEVFTQISKDEERVAFLKVLTDAVAVENGRVTLLFAMRSDFVSNCATYEKLNDILNQQFRQIGAMSPHDLVNAIAQPALRVGLHVEPDLIAQIINDMQGEPGSLPLMQFALKDLFDFCQANIGSVRLTLKDYLDRGGIRKALERHADESFNKLDGNEKELARSIFSGLIEIGRGTQDTRRTAIFDELVPAHVKSYEVESILRKLADARLVTTDEVAGKDTVTIAHEKLIDAWPWLKKLISENREVIALQNEIANDALEWENHQRDASYLYTGGRLIDTQEKLLARRLVLSGKALEFVNAGIKKHSVNRALMAAGVIAVLAAVIISSLLFVQQNIARANAASAQLHAMEMAEQARINLAYKLAIQGILIQNDNRALALLLNTQAYSINDNFETEGSMLSILQAFPDALLTPLEGHTDSVWDVAFSPDGKLLASGGNDGSIIIWDVATHQIVTSLANKDPMPTIYSLAFDPNSDILAAGDATGNIRLFHSNDWMKAPMELRGHNDGILSLKYSKDGKLLVSGGIDSKVIVWDGDQYTPLRTLSGPSNWIWDVAITRDNQTIAAVGKEKVLRLWDLNADSTTPTIEIASGPFVSATFNDDARSPLLLTGNTNGKVIVWDLRPWQTDQDQPIPSDTLPTGPGATTTVWGLVMIPGHPLDFVTGRDIGILNRNQILWKQDNRQTSLKHESLGVITNPIGAFRIDVSPDGNSIAVAGQDGVVSLWKANETDSVIRHASGLTSLRLVNDSQTAISVDNTGIVKRWDHNQRKNVETLKLYTNGITRSAVSADGVLLVTGYANGRLTLWDARDGKKLFTVVEHTKAITGLAFSLDSKMFASSDQEGTVHLWKISSGSYFEALDTFADPHQSAIQILLFSQDGLTLFGGGCGNPITAPAPDCSQGAVYIWDISSGKLKQKDLLPGKAGFVWSLGLNTANAADLAVGSRDGTVTVWDLQNRTVRLSIRLNKSDITSIAFSPDGKLLAVGADGYKVFLYSALTGQVYGHAFREHDGNVNTLVFTPDGKSLLSASVDNTVVIHNMDPAIWFERACQLANRNLTPDEWVLYVGETLPYEPACKNLPTQAVPVTP